MPTHFEGVFIGYQGRFSCESQIFEDIITLSPPPPDAAFVRGPKSAQGVLPRDGHLVAHL